MKKLLSLILCVTLLLGVFPFVLPVTAVETVDVRSTEFGNLYDNAVFVSNGGNDTTGKVNDKTKPFATINAAANALIAAHDGGYIVIMDAVTCAVDVDYNDHNGVICITSVYDGVDYRNSGAKIVGGYAAFAIMLSGPTIIEKLDMKVYDNGSGQSSFYIAARHNPIQMGDDDLSSEDIRFYSGKDVLVAKSNATSATNRIILHGGYLTGKASKTVVSGSSSMADMGTETNLIINGGCYTWVSGGNYSVDTSMAKHFIVFRAGYAKQLFAGNVTKAVGGVSVSYLLGGEISEFAPGSNVAQGVMRGHTYTVLGACAVGSFRGYYHSDSDTGLYDVLVYDPAVYPSGSGLPTVAEMDYVVPMMDQTKSDNVVYLKPGGIGDGSSESKPCVDLTTAYLILGDNGGTISLCSDYTIAAINSNARYECVYLGKSTAMRYFIVPYHTGKVTIDGNNYSLDAGGKLAYMLSGPTEIKNLKISCASGLFMVARFNDLKMTDVTSDRLWIVGGESLQHYYGTVDVSHRNRGRFTTLDRSAKLDINDVTMEHLYVFNGNVPNGQNYTGKIEVVLTD
ncbi:MAG: hypothetical protein IJN63_01895, partial [Clostridia bacterium]|nr:hypothetical protein [Clostridia bacterium]